MKYAALLAVLLAPWCAATARCEPRLTHVDVFVSGRDGYQMYRIPVIATAPDGSLLAFAEARKFGGADPGFGKQDIDLVLKRSSDGGKTWSAMKVIEDPGDLWSAANPATVVDRQTGRVWVLYLRSKPGRSTATSRSGSDDMQTLARWSADNGITWSEPIDLSRVARDYSDPRWQASVIGPGGAIQTGTGRLVAPVWKVKPCLRATSDDGGRTWSKPRPGEEVTAVACAIQRLSLKSAGDDRNRIIWTGPKGPGRRALVVRVSYDEGQTFTGERLISAEPAAYSDLTVLKDKSVGVLWERGNYKYLTFTRFNLDFLESAR
jgi:sialidase-1